MVYKRRYKKRMIKKKRAYRRRQYKKKIMAKYDGQVKYKIHATYDITAQAATGPKGYFVVNWAGNGIAAGATTARVTVTNEFTNFNQRYAYYKVVGCKVKIHPVVVDTNVALLTVGPIISGTNPQGLPDTATTLAEFQSYADYKSLPPGKTCYKWCAASKFFRRNTFLNYPQVNWLQTTLNYPDMGTMFYLDNVGYVTGQRMAVAEVIWYVKFKGPHL